MKKLTNVLRNHWISYLLSVDPSSWSVSKEYQSNICGWVITCDSNFTYWIWKKHDIYRVYFGKGFVGVALLAMTEKYKTIIKLTYLLLRCKPAKIIINNLCSDWFSTANTLVWAKPCARWAELKMLSFWAGGISSFPPCARKYCLLRRLEGQYHIFSRGGQQGSVKTDITESRMC